MLPFLIPPTLLVVLAAIVVTIGTALLQFGKSEIEIGPVAIAKSVVVAILGDLS